MKSVVAIALVLTSSLAACGKSKSAPAQVQAGPYIQRVTAWGDRACACNADKECVKPIRDEWEAVRYEFRDVSAKFAPADRTAYDTVMSKFRGCSDAAGVTIWID